MGTPNQFRLPVRGDLVMHAPQCAFFCVERNTALSEMRIEPVRFELVLAPRAQEKAPIIGVQLWLDQEYARDFQLMKDHTDPFMYYQAFFASDSGCQFCNACRNASRTGRIFTPVSSSLSTSRTQLERRVIAPLR